MIVLFVKLVIDFFRDAFPAPQTLDEFIAAGSPQSLYDVEMLERAYQRKNSPSMYTRHFE